MAALTADRNTVDCGSFEEQELDVHTSTTIYEGSLVAINASGNAIPATTTAGLRLAGVSQGDKRNGTSTVTAATAGDHKVAVKRTGTHKFACSGLTKADIGKPVYVVDDQTVTLTPGNVFAGVLVGLDSATVAIVDIEPATKSPNRAGTSAGRLFVLAFSKSGTVGTSSARPTAVEIPGAFTLVGLFADVGTAPGSGKTCTVTFTDGTNPKTCTITGTATHGESKNLSQAYPADTDINVTMVDDGSGADLNVMALCQEAAT